MKYIATINGKQYEVMVAKLDAYKSLDRDGVAACPGSGAGSEGCGSCPGPRGCDCSCRCTCPGGGSGGRRCED